jgi:hypothetical protein
MNIKELDKKYVMGTYGRFPVAIVSGKGSLLYDDEGKEYIDMGSGIAVNTFGAADEQWAKAVTDEYRKIRKYFSEDFYNHGSQVLDDTSWAIWQYDDPVTQSGIVMAFRRSNSPFAQVDIALKGQYAGKTLTYTDLNEKVSFESDNVLQICLPEKRSSVILTYKL